MKVRRLTLSVLSGCAVGLGLSGCGNAPAPPPVPQNPVGIYKLGQPYQIAGNWYYPAEDFGYDETGIASSYGPDGDRKRTDNGEILDQNIASGAHRTLALPTIVQVTNLDNGLTIPLRINDRGPPTGNRILEVTHRAAELLGFGPNGIAKIRVKVLVPATIEAQSLAKLNGGDTAAVEPPPPAVPHAAVVAETLPPPGAPQTAPAGAARQPGPVVPPAEIPPGEALPAEARAVRPEPAPTFKPLTASVVPVKSSRLYIQAGAFASGANAQKMKERLDGLGAVTVAGVRVNGVDVYRVRIGPIPTVDEADRLLARALGAGASDAKIIVD